jgi:hypothetical protein
VEGVLVKPPPLYKDQKFVTGIPNKSAEHGFLSLLNIIMVAYAELIVAD